MDISDGMGPLFSILILYHYMKMLYFLLCFLVLFQKHYLSFQQDFILTEEEDCILAVAMEFGFWHMEGFNHNEPLVVCAR